MLVLSKAMITRIRIFLKPDFFLPESAFRPDEISETAHRYSIFLKPLSRVCFRFVLFCFCFFWEPTDLRIRVDNWNQIISNSIE